MAELTDALNEFAHTLYTGLKDAIPTDVTLVQDLPFDKKNEQGGDYTEHIVVAEECGFVHGNPSEMMTAPTGVGMETVKAIVNGYQVGLVSTIDYANAQRASNSKKAYAELAGKKQASGFNSMRRRVEDELWWGQTGIGKVASFADGGTTASILTITLAEWAPWLWAGKKNHKVVFYNSTTAIASGNAFTISAVNLSRATPTVKVTGAQADITELETQITSLGAGVIDIYWYGTATASLGAGFKSMLGLMKCAATRTGTLLNVDLDANTDAAPQAYAAGGALSFTKCAEIAEVMIGRGVVEPIRLDVSPRTWNNVMLDQAALVRYGGKQTKIQNGAEAIEFQIQRVPVEIVGEGRMKEGYAVGRPKSGLKRIGARDISMATPGAQGAEKGDIWYHDPSRFGYTWRIWTHQAFFTEEFWKLCYVSGIVNQ
jgi:hypothetical protein